MSTGLVMMTLTRL